MKAKKMLAIILGMMTMVASVSTMAKNPLKVTINDEVVTFKEGAPFIDANNRILVPLRLMSETLGAEVKWDKATQTTTITQENKEVKLTIGEAKMLVNGEMQAMDTKPVLKDGNVYVPVKYIGEVFGTKVQWLPEENTLALSNELPGDTVIAKVNDEVIVARDVLAQINYEMAMMQSQYQYDASYFESEEAKAYIKERKAEIVDYIIKNKVALIKGKEMKLVPTTDEVMAQVSEVKASYETPAAFEAALANAGLTQEAYMKQIGDGITITNVINEISKKVKATDSEIKAYYEAHSADYVNAPGANMAHILVATEEEAKAVKAEYDKGTSFADLAKKYGTDGTKDHGGELGYIEYASRAYDQDFLAGAKTLKEGEVSAPVKTQFGWHLIKVTNVHQEVYSTPLEEVKAAIEKAVIAEKATPTIYEQLEKWQQEMTVEKYEDLINKL